MKILAEHARNKALSRDALQISAEAKKAKQLDSEVIDATLGTFYYNDGLFRVHNTIKYLLNDLSDQDKYLYSTSGGNLDFHNACMNWFFQKSRGTIDSKLFSSSTPTPGGTGAIVAAVNNATNINDIILIPNPCWGPYVGICESRGRKVKKYNLFKNGKFNLDSLKETAEEVLKIQNKLIIFLNDPCNNPTGYSMACSELNELINYLNSLSNIPVILLYDSAYIDMASCGMEETRKKLEVFTNINENVMILVAMSFSKTFFVYGQRLGAQLILGKNKEEVDEFSKANSYFARNTWSNCNKALISLLTKLDKDEEATKNVKEEIALVVSELNARGKLFVKEAKNCGLEILPFDSGFFISIPCKNNELVLDKLVEEEKIYLIPIAGCVRVAICSLPINSIYGLAAKIKKIIDKYDNK